MGSLGKRGCLPGDAGGWRRRMARHSWEKVGRCFGTRCGFLGKEGVALSGEDEGIIPNSGDGLLNNEGEKPGEKDRETDVLNAMCGGSMRNVAKSFIRHPEVAAGMSGGC